MKRISIFLMTVACLAAAEPLPAADIDRERALEVASAVQAGFAEIVAQFFLEPKATYLENYGLVVTTEVALEPPRNPFSSPRSPEDVRRSSLARRDALESRAMDLLAEQVAGLDGLRPDEHVSLVIYMVNANPVDLPDIPAQMVISVLKQDALDMASGTIDEAVFRQRISIRED